MASKRSRKRAQDTAADAVAQTVRDSAQKIWLAGLGAFERAKTEGPKMFETLVAQGKGLRERATEAADQALKSVREQAGEAQGKWDKLEQVFEDRVSRSLHRLGVLTSRELGDLQKQVGELDRTVQDMMAKRRKDAAPAKKPRARKAGAKKAGAKKARARKPRSAKAK